MVSKQRLGINSSARSGWRIYAGAFLALGVLTMYALVSGAAYSEVDLEPVVGGQSLEYTFEDKDSQGWIPRGGGVKMEVVRETAHTGEYSLKTTNRTANWHGPSLDLTGIVKKGEIYEITGYVKLLEKPATASNFKITMEQKKFGAGTSWKTVAQSTVNGTQWVKLSGTYSFAEDLDTLLLYIESENPKDAYYIDDVTIKGSGFERETVMMEPGLPALCEVYADYFTIGAAVEPEQLNKPESELLKKHYNVIAAENVMKPGYIQPLEGIYNWANSDRIVKFALEHKMEVRYHTLVWHQQCSEWFFLDEDGKEMIKETDPMKRAANKELLLRRLEKHITAIVERYKDHVKYWDVVNEVIDPAEPDGMRKSKWYQITGTDYIETAFRTARKAGGPGIKLYINDYSTSDPAKRDFLYRLVTELLDKGVPIDGVGHQAHINLEAPSMAALSDSIKLFAGLGLDNQLTELDVSVYTNDYTAYQRVPEELLVQQGHRYKELFAALKELKDYISNVTFWGIADNHSWLHNRPIPRRDAPFAFDQQFKAKPAYWGMVDPEKLPILTQKLNVFKGKKTIDGVEETAWKTAPRIGLTANGGPPASGFKVAWDNRRVYILADVRDSTVDQDDLVEVFIDENNGKTGTYQKDDKHIIFRRDGKRARGATYRVHEYDGGYLVEASINTRGLSPDQEIGFDLRITDAAPANSSGVVSWNDLHSQSGSGYI